MTGLLCSDVHVLVPAGQDLTSADWTAIGTIALALATFSGAMVSIVIAIHDRKKADRQLPDCMAGRPIRMTPGKACTILDPFMSPRQIRLLIIALWIPARALVLLLSRRMCWQL